MERATSRSSDETHHARALDDGEPGPLVPAHEGDGVFERYVDVKGHHAIRLGELCQADLVGVAAAGDDPGHDVAATHHSGQAAVVEAEGDAVLAVGGEKQAASAAVSVVRSTSMSPDMTSRMVLMVISHRGTVGAGPPLHPRALGPPATTVRRHSLGTSSFSPTRALLSWPR